MLAPARRQLGLVVALGLLITVTYLVQGILLAYVIARVLRGAGLGPQLPLLAGVVVLVVARAVLLRWREAVSATAAELVKVELRGTLYARLLELGPAYTVANRTGDSTTTLVDAVETLDAYVAIFIPQLATTIIGSTAIAIGMFAIDPVVGLVVAGSSLAVGFAPQLLRSALARRHKNYWTQWRVLGAEYLDAIQGLTTLKAMGVSLQHGRRLEQRSREFYRASVGLNAYSNLGVGAVGFIAAAGTALAVGAGALRMTTGALDALGLLLVLLLSREAFRPLTDLQLAMHSSYRVVPSASAIFALLDTAPVVTSPRAAIAVAPKSSAPTIKFEEVTYTYGARDRDRDRQALRTVNFTVDAGRTLALVGPSGAGKTTAISLLLRIIDPDEGAVRIGGHDVRQFGLPELRGLVAVVSQDVYLFRGTVAENIGLGRPTASRAQIRAAAAAAGAEEFIDAMPQGLDTIIGERGLTLSGGERQRLAIARAILKDAPLLVLDEATSAVDSATELLIRDAVQELAVGRTTLVVAHRLSAIRHADQVVVLDQGRVTETGTHASLISVGGRYSQLMKQQ